MDNAYYQGNEAHHIINKKGGEKRMSRYTSIYLTSCAACGNSTSKKYAKEHGGLCKLCATGENKSMLCPDCKTHYLTSYQKQHHYHCDYCTREADPEGYRREVMGLNDYGD